MIPAVAAIVSDEGSGTAAGTNVAVRKGKAKVAGWPFAKKILAGGTPEEVYLPYPCR